MLCFLTLADVHLLAHSLALNHVPPNQELTFFSFISSSLFRPFFFLHILVNGSSRSAVISGTAAAVVVVGALFVMLYRKRKTRSTYSRRDCSSQPKEMEDTTRPGHSWLSRSRSKESRDRDGDMARDDDSNRHGRLGAQTIEAQLFEGFESSVMIEDHEHRPQYNNDKPKPQRGHRHSSSEDRTRTSSSRPTMTSISSTFAHATRLDSIQSHSSTASQPPSQQSRSNSVTQASQKVTQFATKLGQKLGHLRVKTHLSDPTSTGSSSHNLPVPPISPISPVSPTLPSPTKPHLETEPGTGTGTGGTIERNPASATPSFSSVSVPSVASNRHGQTTARSEISITMPLCSPTSCSPEKHFLPKSPPSPISPTMASATSPTSSSLHHNPKFQKEHRSMLIKDLILQGDDALDEKEQALMAQYQPYHCQQQLLIQQHKQQMKHQHQHQQKAPRQSSVTMVDPVATGSLTRQSSLGSGSRAKDDDPVFVPTTTTHTQQQQRPTIPAIDTNYLAPPPRIYIHKPL